MISLHAPVAIDESVKIGEGSTVWRFTTVCEGTVIGENSVIGSNCFIGKNCRIGNGVHIQHGCFLPHGTVVEDFAFFGPNVVLTDDKWPRAGNDSYLALPPVIRTGASIGANATILPGVEVRAHAMVAAGAVVTRDVHQADVVVGLPARGRFETTGAKPRDLTDLSAAEAKIGRAA